MIILCSVTILKASEIVQTKTSFIRYYKHTRNIENVAMGFIGIYLPYCIIA